MTKRFLQYIYNNILQEIKLQNWLNDNYLNQMQHEFNIIMKVQIQINFMYFEIKQFIYKIKIALDSHQKNLLELIILKYNHFINQIYHLPFLFLHYGQIICLNLLQKLIIYFTLYFHGIFGLLSDKNQIDQII